MDGIFNLTDDSIFVQVMGEDPLHPGDLLEFVGRNVPNLVVVDHGEQGWHKFAAYDKEYYWAFPASEIQGSVLMRRGSVYSDTGYGPAISMKHANIARIIKENFGGDQETIMDTVMKIDAIYESTK